MDQVGTRINWNLAIYVGLKNTSKFIFCRPTKLLDHKFWSVLIKTVSTMGESSFPQKILLVYLGLKKHHIGPTLGATDLVFGRFFWGRSTGFELSDYRGARINWIFGCIYWVKKTSKFVFCRPTKALEQRFWSVSKNLVSTIGQATFPQKILLVYLGLKKHHIGPSLGATDLVFGRFFWGRSTGFDLILFGPIGIIWEIACIPWVKNA